MDKKSNNFKDITGQRFGKLVVMEYAGSNDKGSNCRWADNITQANNKRNNVCYELNGETKTINQWCREYNISYSVVHQRIKKFGYTLKEALETPVKKYGGKK